MVKVRTCMFTVPLLWLASIGIVGGLTDYDPVKDFCRRYSQSSAVIKDRLYIDGGQLNLFNQDPRKYTNKRLLFHDTAQQEVPSMPPLGTNLSKPDSAPSLIGGALWADQANAKLFQYGGDWPEGEIPDQMSLWVYDEYADSWSKLPVSTQDRQEIDRVSFGAMETVEYLGHGFVLGGWKGERNSFSWQGERQAAGGLLEYDFVNNQWWNRTGPADGKGRAEGAMFYVPAGDIGMLVHFGGVQTPKGGTESDATSAPMDVIDIYDMGNQKWMVQNATGDIPERRRRFCGGIISAPDGSSHNIYITAGMGFGENKTGYDDIYILTIPAFKWIKVYPVPGTTRAPEDAYPSYDMSCNVVRNNLLVIGGQFPADPDVNACDVANDVGVHNIVLSKDPDGEFWGLYNPNLTSYRVPSEITSIIGGDTGGHATKTTPDGGFTNFNLGPLFKRVVTPAPRAATRSPSPSPSSSGSTTPKTRQLMIIIPSVIGGVFLLLALGTFLYCRRRHQKSPAPAAELAYNYTGVSGTSPAPAAELAYNYTGVSGTSRPKTPQLHSPVPQNVPAYPFNYATQQHEYPTFMEPQELRGHSQSPVEMMTEQRR
ncbi:hypothetical protein EDC01DRAFT_311134 [Geopyxis carbonaria]|nr:hypothetical protein EDC01DRAFT_311134 [Geopyxis carbonaria]